MNVSAVGRPHLKFCDIGITHLDVQHPVWLHQIRLVSRCAIGSVSRLAVLAPGIWVLP